MPLEDLLVDEATIDQERLADVLRNLVGITGDGGLRPLDGWERLRQGDRIIAGLLALKAARLLLKRSSDSVTPTELSELTGIAIGTVKPTLRGLVVERIVAQQKDGRYHIPGIRLEKAITHMRSRKK